MVPSADLAENVTIGGASLAEPISVATAGVAFQEECGESVMFRVARFVIMMTILMMDIMTTDRTILIMMMRVTLIDTLVCMALLGRIIMSCIMICRARMTVGYIVYLGAMSVWCHTGVEMRKGTCMRVMLSCPGLVPTSRADMLGYNVVSTFGLGGPGGPCEEEGDVYEGDVALPRTGSDELVISVVSAIGQGRPCDETGSVADAPGDAIIESSESREIDRGTLDKIQMW